jgi:hypothetical protein
VANKQKHAHWPDCETIWHVRVHVPSHADEGGQVSGRSGLLIL